jgi:hypothetical protein
MRLNFRLAGAAKAFRLGLFAMVVSCALTGCGDYCIVGIFNPGGMTSTNPTCPPSKPTSNVTLTFASSLEALEAAPSRTPHLFVTLRGIEGLTAPVANEDASGWQELAPQLADRPVQVDLTAPATHFCESGPLGSAEVPAGVYRQLRLHLVPNPPLSSETAAPPLEASSCGTNVFSCLIPRGGATAQPLTWDDPADIVIPSERIADGFIRVLPETSVHVSIALDSRSSLVLAAGADLRLMPSFYASAQPGCPSTESF